MHIRADCRSFLGEEEEECENGLTLAFAYYTHCSCGGRVSRQQKRLKLLGRF